MIEFILIEPTMANLPLWAIVTLVGAVGALSGIVLKNMNDDRSERKELQKKIDELYEQDRKRAEEALADQKKIAIILNENLKFMEKFINNE